MPLLGSAQLFSMSSAALLCVFTKIEKDRRKREDQIQIEIQESKHHCRTSEAEADSRSRHHNRDGSGEPCCGGEERQNSAQQSLHVRIHSSIRKTSCRYAALSIVSHKFKLANSPKLRLRTCQNARRVSEGCGKKLGEYAK